jgi:hypothetical protein
MLKRPRHIVCQQGSRHERPRVLIEDVRAVVPFRRQRRQRRFDVHEMVGPQIVPGRLGPPPPGRSVPLQDVLNAGQHSSYFRQLRWAKQIQLRLRMAGTQRSNRGKALYEIP